MLFIHPIIQAFAILAAWFVFYEGLQRFRFQHLHHQATFAWKRHVMLGMTSLFALLVGVAVGLIMVRISWYGFMVTGTHAHVGLIMVPLIVFGYGSGVYMNLVRKKRTLLPLFHGANNLIMLALALTQIATGYRVLTRFLLGY